MSNPSSVQASAGISWAELDEVFDWIPVASAITNLVNLIFKCFVLPGQTPKSIAESPSYTRMEKKPVWQCLVFMLFSGFAKIFFWIGEKPAVSNPPQVTSYRGSPSVERKTPLTNHEGIQRKSFFQP